jgi:dCMP deaminase
MKDKFKLAFMDCAERFAQLSSAKRAQVGAIIVKDNRIVSIGYNGMPSGWTNECEEVITWNDVPHMRKEYEESGATMHESPHGSTWSRLKTKDEVLHAETNAIAKMAQSNESTKDAVLFCTHEPCLDCAKLIHQSGIRHVIFKNSYKADKGSGYDFLEKSGCKVEKLS